MTYWSSLNIVVSEIIKRTCHSVTIADFGRIIICEMAILNSCGARLYIDMPWQRITVWNKVGDFLANKGQLRHNIENNFGAQWNALNTHNIPTKNPSKGKSVKIRRSVAPRGNFPWRIKKWDIKKSTFFWSQLSDGSSEGCDRKFEGMIGCLARNDPSGTQNELK